MAKFNPQDSLWPKASPTSISPTKKMPHLPSVTSTINKPNVWPTVNLMMPSNMTAEFAGSDMMSLFGAVGHVPKVPGTMEPKNSIQDMLRVKRNINNR